MTNRSRLLSLLVVGLLPFVARIVHQAFRAPAGATEAYGSYALLSLLTVVVVAVMEAPPRTSSVTRVFVSTSAVALVLLGATATTQVFAPASLPRFVILFNTLLVAVWLMIVGTIMAVVLRRRGGSSRVLALVDRADADLLRADIEGGPLEQRFVLVDIALPPDEYGTIAEHCEALGITTLVLGMAQTDDPVVIAQAEIVHSQGVRVRSLDDFYDESIGKLPLSGLDRFALMGDVQSLHGAYAPLKRAIDLAMAVAGSVVLVVLLPFVLIGNLIANRGPLMFRQERVGRGGRAFRIWKFRTMAPGAVDVSGWTSNDDPRITPFGKLLRRTHVDELPQVVNIFAGELAVVGPRPEQVVYARQLTERLPFYSARHLVRPGLTGWAQVRYRYAASEEDAYVKLQYDLYYVRHESLSTDLRIIWLTVRHLLVDGGR